MYTKALNLYWMERERTVYTERLQYELRVKKINISFIFYTQYLYSLRII